MRIHATVRKIDTTTDKQQQPELRKSKSLNRVTDEGKPEQVSNLSHVTVLCEVLGLMGNVVLLSHFVAKTSSDLITIIDFNYR